MKISLLILGTRGDVQPFIALALGLKNRGYKTIICAPKSFKRLVEDYKVEFHPVSSDYKELLDSTEGKNLLKYYPFSVPFNFKKVILPFMYKGFDDYWNYTKDSDFIIYHPKVLVAPDIAEKLNVPCIISVTVPMLSKTADFLNPYLKVYRQTPGWLNRLSYSINGLMQQPFKGIVNEWRESRLQLPKRKSFSEITKIDKSSIPVIYSCSSHIVPKPEDWPDNTIISGYWFLDDTKSWKIPEILEDFLNSGKPPVCFAFSSLPIENPKKLIKIIRDALENTNQRGIIVSGWTELKADKPYNNLLLLKPLPYSWIFPKAKLIVHHGGAGTTSEAIKAKKPMVVCPYNVDQPFWAKQCYRLGISTKPIPFKRLTVKKLSAAINEIIENKKISQKAEETGYKLNLENGVETALDFIEKFIH